MNVLVTGGAGYIGSHTCVELIEAGHTPIVIDNLSNSNPESLRRVAEITGKTVEFIEGDVRDEALLEKIFAEHEISCTIHFAGLKAVGESVAKPMEYYQNNLDATLMLCKVMAKHNVKRIIFSSSATVYSGDNEMPLRETSKTGNCTNPYGWTKYMGEQILRDIAKADPEWSVVNLRYFNPVGAHESGKIGEHPNGIPNNLMPYISQTAIGKRDHLNVFGNDYPTPDGTGVRDYIHVVDLAKGHVAAIQYLMTHTGEGVFNLGTGHGYSVLDMVHAFEEANGVKVPYTEATTSMLFNPTTKDWDWQTIESLGLPKKIFTPLDRAGSLRGTLRPELAEELGLNQAHFAAVGTHDTASAVAAIPGTGSFAFCSSGTWSLFGVETDEPILSDAVRDANFSNEGTIQGGFRPLKNIMGLWLIQECRRDWQKAGQNLSWNDIVEEAKKAEPFRSIIDPDYGEFFAGGRMVEKIQAFCRETNQPVPETVGQIARCIYESLALKYRWALERLEEIKGQRIDTLNIVGGGCQNKLLNQFAADSIDRPVITGPIEGAAIGNLLAQAMALGDIQTMDELRTVVRRSEAVRTYEPHHTPEWEAAYQKMRTFL